MKRRSRITTKQWPDTRGTRDFFARAGVYYTRKDYPKARDDYSRVIELAPTAGGLREPGTRQRLHLKEFNAALEDWDHGPAGA